MAREGQGYPYLWHDMMMMMMMINFGLSEGSSSALVVRISSVFLYLRQCLVLNSRYEFFQRYSFWKLVSGPGFVFWV